MDDITLLREYAETASETAFTTLVERYVNLVYSTALRSIGNPHAAEEITQAVFIILARKARSLPGRTILSGWLYQTTRLTAANFLRGEIRRQKREQEAYMQSVLNEPEIWPQIAPLLDAAMERLGGKDRNAIVLRYFENKSLGEVGAAMGASEDAAKMRVNRALEKLRKIFTKRGVTLSGALIAGAVSANSVHAAPVGLAATAAATAAKGTAISATITTLVKGTMKTMTWIKLKFAAGVGVAALLAGGVATVAISQTGNDSKMAAQEIIKDSQDAYAALSSYSDSGKVIAKVGGQTITTTFTIRLQRPNLYRVEWSQAVAASFTNGGAVWSAGNGDFMLMTMTGQQNAKPTKKQDMQTALAAATGVSGQASATIPGTFFKQNWGDALKAPVSGRTRLEKQNDETIDGVDCYVVSSIIGPVTNQGKSVGNTTTTLWIGKQDSLIHQTRTVVEGISITLPQMSDSKIKEMLEQQNKPATPEAIAAARKRIEAGMKQAQAMMKSGRFVFTQTHENIVVNQQFSPADFAR